MSQRCSSMLGNLQFVSTHFKADNTPKRCIRRIRCIERKFNYLPVRNNCGGAMFCTFHCFCVFSCYSRCLCRLRSGMPVCLVLRPAAMERPRGKPSGDYGYWGTTTTSPWCDRGHGVSDMCDRGHGVSDMCDWGHGVPNMCGWSRP